MRLSIGFLAALLSVVILTGPVAAQTSRISPSRSPASRRRCSTPFWAVTW